MKRKLVAIVPAAGVGARAGAGVPKQYRDIGGQPMLRRAVTALLADLRIDQVRVALAAGDVRGPDVLRGLERTVWRACGGATRALTVMQALSDADLDEADWVLVHDAARPGLPAQALARLISACLDSGRGGLLALPVADTVKQAAPASADGRVGVARSVPRQGLWLAQTPQMFPAGLLRQALAQALAQHADITDEASAMELAGHVPQLIEGSLRNFKVTWPEDADLMAKWLVDCAPGAGGTGSERSAQAAGSGRAAPGNKE